MEEYKFLIGKEGLAAKAIGIRGRDFRRDFRNVSKLIRENSDRGFPCISGHPTNASTLNDIPRDPIVKGRNLSIEMHADNFDLEGFYEDISKSKYHIIEMGFAGEARRC